MLVSLDISQNFFLLIIYNTPITPSFLVRNRLFQLTQSRNTIMTELTLIAFDKLLFTKLINLQIWYDFESYQI